MSLQIYTKRDIRDGIASCVGLAVAMSENHTLDFMRGVLVHARAQARLYGISWQDIVEEISVAELGRIVKGHTVKETA